MLDCEQDLSCVLSTGMMRLSVVVVFVLVSALSLTEAARIRRDEKYTTKFDYVNVDDILASNRLLNNYVNCLLDKGRCSPEGTELKSRLSDALQTECAKCSEKQKEASEKVIKFLYNNKPAEWKQLQQKYDPSNIYVKKYEKQLKEVSA